MIISSVLSEIRETIPSNAKLFVFYDLEETLIESVFKIEVCNLSFNQEISYFLSNFEMVNFTLMSWAINNHNEIKEFRDYIEPSLNPPFKFENIYTPDMALDLVKSDVGRHVMMDLDDLFCFYRKQDIFKLYASAVCSENSVYILIDDTIDKTSIECVSLFGLKYYLVLINPKHFSYLDSQMVNYSFP